MSETVELRVLRPADLAALDELIVEGEADGFGFVRRIPRELAADPHYFDSERTVVLGVFEEERLLAVGGLTPDPYLGDPSVGRIRHVYVARAHRRRGIGRQLLGALERRARTMFTTLRLRADSVPAAAFYESLGFQAVSANAATHRRSLVDDSRGTPPHDILSSGEPHH